jgi:hypothetical protein
MNSTKAKCAINGSGAYEDFRKRILQPFDPSGRIDLGDDPELHISREVWQAIEDRETKDSQSANRVKAWTEKAQERGKAINAFFVANKAKDWLSKWIKKTTALVAFKGSLFTAGHMKTLDVTPKPPLIGDWLCEGDIGFIFAARGVGKTWLGLDLAKSISTGGDLGPYKSGAVRKVLYVDGEVSASGQGLTYYVSCVIS